MPWTLADAVANERDPFRKGVLSIFWMESNLLAAIPFETVNRLKMEIRRINRLSLTKASWVKVGDTYGTATINLDSIEEEVFKLGRDIQVPRDLADLEGQFEDPLTVNIEANLKAVAYECNEAMVNGPNVGGTTGTFVQDAPTGIQLRCTSQGALAGLADAVVQTAAGGTAFGSSASSSNRHTVLDAIDQSYYFVDQHMPDWGACNDSLLRAMNSAFRREGTLFAQTRDQFGRWVNELRGVPIYDVGLKYDQATRIIGNAELSQDGTTATCTSLYLIKNGVGTHFAGFEKEALSVRDFGELQTGPTLLTRLDWHVGWINAHPRCLSRVAGIRATT